MFVTVSAYFGFASRELTPQPRHVKAWLKALPLADIGETTRQFFHGLTQLNQQPADPKDRLKSMEAMQGISAMVLDRLQRHFVNRTLPLPLKSRQVVELYDELLEEISAGYRKVLEDAKASKRSLSKADMALTIFRAMQPLCRLLYNAARLYRPAPIGLWQKLNALFALAEQHGLLQITLKSGDKKTRTKTTIAETYFAVALLFLARPLSLRQGEAELLIGFLQKHARQCVLNPTATPDAQGRLYLIDLCEDRAPFYIIASDIKLTESIRTFSPAKLVQFLHDHFQNHPRESSLDGLNRDLAERILVAWISKTKRQFSRFEREETVDVVIGLDAIHAHLMNTASVPKDSAQQNEALSDKPAANPANAAPGFALLDNDAQYEAGKTGSDYYMQFVTGGIQTEDADTWEAVFAGKVSGMSLDGSINVSSKPLGFGQYQCKEGVECWNVLDISVGGFRLLWNKNEASRAQVGQLISFAQDFISTQENDEHEHTVNWTVGVIRWITFTEDKRLELGAQTLAPKVDAVLVRHALNEDEHGYGEQFAGLLFTPAPVAEHPATIALPLHKFQSGDKVMFYKGSEPVHASLDKEYARYALVSQFTYTLLNQPKAEPSPAAQAEEKAQQRFATIWGSI
ncbi:hypothetical protein [Thiorhodospira sibirica]|uniref:hypothetical protein n=1 Tax=Thiorhodospira sibirica TaxID=154347 RepID=UPI00022C52B4|nr:hypothetical protein [Thiorhodospira sibirica]